MEGNILLHNHPHDASFSPGDIRLAMHRGLAEIRAVTARYRYTMRPLEGGWSLQFWAEVVEPLLRRERLQLNRRLRRRVRRGAITDAQLDERGWHTLWEAIAEQLGFQYSRERLT
jgi:hypothetical protein